MSNQRRRNGVTKKPEISYTLHKIMKKYSAPTEKSKSNSHFPAFCKNYHNTGKLILLFLGSDIWLVFQKPWSAWHPVPDRSRKVIAEFRFSSKRTLLLIIIAVHEKKGQIEDTCLVIMLPSSLQQRHYSLLFCFHVSHCTLSLASSVLH
jgi:hypothetical protein